MTTNPALPRYDHFYDKQIVRHLEQLVRGFSGLSYQTGRRNGNAPELRTVPCLMAITNKMVASIRRNLSENVINSTPMITVGLSGLAYDPARLQLPNHVDHRYAVERQIENGAYTTLRGSDFSIERIMPKPLDLTIQIDLWTSNQDQKFQIVEQLINLIIPGFDVQNSENPLDWTAKTTCRFESMNWSSISIPVGTSDEIDIFSVTMKLPIWISPPSKVTRGNLVEEVITEIGSDADQENDLTTLITTLTGQSVSIDSGTISLLGSQAQTLDDAGHSYQWNDLFTAYKKQFRPGISRFTLRPVLDDTAFDIVGTLWPTSGHPNQLSWVIDIDTLPSNTLPQINGLIDPARTFPGTGLPVGQKGIRYLLLGDLPEIAAWNNLVAHAGDIITFTESGWVISFNASLITEVQYVYNATSGKQLKFNNKDWTLAIGGVYHPGSWRISL